jgi:NitT/TauT family transport system ATP-binding protein
MVDGYGEVVVENVTKQFGDEYAAKVVVRNCSFVVARGELTVLIGPSGCGKTTLINLIAGYERPTSGQILLDGKPISGPSWDRLVVFQENALFPWMHTLGNVTYGPQVRRAGSRREIEAEALRLLDKVGLRDFKDKYPIQLSGGMQRRAELARALINDPKVMLMDEPFRGLDAMTRELMQEYFLRLFEESRRTTLFVTSELEEAIFLADTLIVLTRSPAAVKTQISVDLPRPRELRMLTSQRYGELKAEALEALHEEAVQAFSTGSKAAYDLVEAFGRRARDRTEDR